MKILYEAAADENLPRPVRELVVGAIIYAVSPNDPISGDRREDFAGYADDCIMLRLALGQVGKQKDEDSAFFRSRFAEFFEVLEGELAICKKAMGTLFNWLEDKLKVLTKLEYKGKKVKDYLDDEEARDLLYEDGLGFATDYPVDEEDLSDRFKKASTILDVIQRRKDEEDRAARATS